jgi:hypothetical protein
MPLFFIGVGRVVKIPLSKRGKPGSRDNRINRTETNVPILPEKLYTGR